MIEEIQKSFAEVAEIVDLDFTTQGVGDPTPIPSFTEDMEMSFELDYKQTKNFVWKAVLNLKQCKKHLVSKNMLGVRKSD